MKLRNIFKRKNHNEEVSSVCDSRHVFCVEKSFDLIPENIHPRLIEVVKERFEGSAKENGLDLNHKNLKMAMEVTYRGGEDAYILKAYAKFITDKPTNNF